MSEPNNVNNDSVGPFTNVCQSSYPEDFNFEDANPPSASLSLSDNVDVMSMNAITMDCGDYTGKYASYQGNPSVSYFHLNPPSHDQVEPHANSSCPLQVPFQTYCGSSDSYPDTSIPYSDTTNNSQTDNYFQHLGMINNSSTSYIFTHEPTGSGYVVTKVECTQSVLGEMSAADFNQMLATTRM
ncbi:7904_t:CDS:1 [Paraglomus brasilianum]|uniref:7904_t:CDS:1 n=1 Tax=Paraglomus brasilianum TaxID=144538 RepID=A0A9N9GPM8_9GLOM|nr:7904_t:CDS:1 [Paraglomus brasilianum]